MARVLITGVAGNLGKTIANLLSGKHEIIGVDLIDSDFTTIKDDLTDWKSIKAITKGVSFIIHTASLHAPHVRTHSREDFINTNIKGTLYLLDAAKVNSVKKLIYTSTTSLYGGSLYDGQKAVWVTEELPAKTRDIYDITKITAEELCKDFFDPSALQTLSLRVSRFWNEPLQDKVFYRMFRGVDVRDAAQAHILAMEHDFNDFETFNISSQSIFEPTDLFDLRANLLSLLEKKCNSVVELFQRKNWLIPQYIDRVYVIDKAKAKLGYSPINNIDKLVEEIRKSPD